MDKLLTQSPHRLESEREELFALITRFSNVIDSYQDEYALKKEQMRRDISKREYERELSLKSLRETHSNQERIELESFNDQISQIDAEISDCQVRTSRSQKEMEDALSDFQRDQLEKMDLENQNQLALIHVYYLDRDEVLTYIEEMKKIFEKSFIDKGNLKKINDELNSSRIGDIISNQAAKVSSKDILLEAQKHYLKIKEIGESGFLKVVLSHKLNFHIGKLIETKIDFDRAIAFLEMQYEEDRAKREKESEAQYNEMRKQINMRKQALVDSKNQAIADLNAQKNALQEKYRMDSQVQHSAHADFYREREESLQNQIESTRRRWQENLKICSQEFLSMMEREFPKDRMINWLREFWRYPEKLEHYSKMDLPQLNVMLGFATLDISKWYEEETGEVIKKVLSQYPLLFGSSNELAKKMYQDRKLMLPYTISIERGTSLLIDYDDDSHERVKQSLNAIGMRLLRSVPACSMRFHLFDASGIGTFAKLMSLDPSKMNNPSEPTVKSIALREGGQHLSNNDFSRQISEMKITMDDLSAQFTRCNSNSIREFNLQNPLSRQIYKPILMMNFPVGLEAADINSLLAMSGDCSRLGFSMILAQNEKLLEDSKPEIKAGVEKLKNKILCLKMEANKKFLKVMKSECDLEEAAEIYLLGLPENNQIEIIAKEIREKSVEASRLLIRFKEAGNVFTKKEDRYQCKADDGIIVPVGYIDGGQPFELQFSDNHVNTMILGNIGSGKSNLLHVLMTNTMLRYSPSEVMIYLIDFKYGLDFRIYTQYNLPNFKSICISNDPEFALTLIESLEEETNSRSQRMGTQYQKISEYNQHNPTRKMNRILLVIDELYELVQRADEDVKNRIIAKLDSFAHRQRAFGIHMVLSGQDLDKIDKFDTIKSQCSTRLALHCGDEQVKKLMDTGGDDAIARMHTIDRTDRGACVFSLKNGASPQIEHTTFLGAQDQGSILKEIQDHYLSQNIITNVRILLTKVSDNPNHIIEMFVSKGYIKEFEKNRLFIGDCISMEEEFKFVPKGNVWITGASSNSSCDAANSILFFSALSLLLEKKRGTKMRILCNNCIYPDADFGLERRDLFGQLTWKHKQYFEYGAAENFEKNLLELQDILYKRRANEISSDEPLWWLVVKPEQVCDYNSNLIQILKEGPQYNIHTILWNSDVIRAQFMQIDKSHFEDIICLEMNKDEIKYVYGRELQPEPKGFNAVLIGHRYNRMRFRVYDLPEGNWMNILFDRLSEE